MDSQLKPCPHCGSTDLQVDWNSVYECHFVRCYNCHMQGPEIYGREKAAEAWNNLPRRHTIYPNVVDCEGCPERRYHKDLKWTSEPPAQPGWYFTRRNRPGKPVRVVYVKEEKRFDHRVKEERKFMTMAETRSETGYIIEELNQDDRQWAGPIPSPK